MHAQITDITNFFFLSNDAFAALRTKFTAVNTMLAGAILVILTVLLRGLTNVAPQLVSVNTFLADFVVSVKSQTVAAEITVILAAESAPLICSKVFRAGTAM